MYIYPENLKAKPMLWLWQLRDVVIICVIALLGALLLTQGGGPILLLAGAIYAFLSIRVEDNSVLDFLRYAARFLFLKQQYFEWRPRDE